LQGDSLLKENFMAHQKLPAPAPSPAQPNPHPTTYADLAFERMSPIFEASVCEAYKDDFYRHDLEILKSTAVPGSEYIWSINPCGTHLLMPGSRQVFSCVEQMLRDYNPQRRELYHVRVHLSSVSVTGINDERARFLASSSWNIETRRDKDFSGRRPTMYAWFRDGHPLGSATVAMRYVKEDNQGWTANVAASIPRYLSQHTQMVLSRLAMEAVVSECGTLFSRIESFDVNEAPFDDWFAPFTKISAVPAPSETPGKERVALRLVAT
jgi:hypothetical protein